MTDTTTPTFDELAQSLRAQADGHLPTMAAVDLLIDHGNWPLRLLSEGHITLWPASSSDGMAAVDWPAVAARLTDRTGNGFAASSSEETILAVATSLAGHHDVRLGDLLPRLDAHNTGLVATAVATACNSGTSVTVQRPTGQSAAARLFRQAPKPDSLTAGAAASTDARSARR